MLRSCAAAAAACPAASARWRGSPVRRARRPPAGVASDAIIAALSVQNSGRGYRTFGRRVARAQPARCAAPVRADAAGDDQRRHTGLRSARAHFATSVSTTASWNSRQRRRASARPAVRLRVATTTAVFRPLKLNSSPGRSSIGRGNSNLPGPSAARESRQLRPAGIRQAEQLRRLVERLAGGVVAGLAEDLVVAEPAHVDEHGVAAGDQQREVRKRRAAPLRAAARAGGPRGDARRSPARPQA